MTFHAQLEKEWGTEVSWQWYDQDGNPISDNDTYSGAETDTLIVTADKAMDGKGYYCVISDDYRTAQTDVSNMIVEEETTDPEEPGQNPGGGTQTPENPGSGTETPENPGSGTQTPSNPGTGAETPGHLRMDRQEICPLQKMPLEVRKRRIQRFLKQVTCQMQEHGPL